MSSCCGRAELVRVFSEKNLLGETANLFGYELAPLPPAAPGEERVRGEVRPESCTAVSLPGTLRESPSVSGTTAAARLKPKGRFLCATAVSYAEDRATAEVKKAETAPWEEPTQGDVLGFPDPDPLVSWPRLWRRLRPHLGQRMGTRELDVEGLVRRICRADPIVALPRQVRLRFAARPRLLLDRTRRQMPFWHDQDVVSAALERWMLEDHLRPFAFPDGMNPGDCLEAGGVDFGGGPRGDVVLLLGDLGAYGDERDREQWLRAGQWLIAQGAELRAVVPCPGWRLDRRLATLWNAIPWDAGERSAPHLSEAERRERADQLLTIVSSAIRVELGMLREARSLLPAGATDSGTEADVLSHPAVIGHSSVALSLDSGHQKRLRAKFDELEDSTREAVHDLLKRWHDKLPPEILFEEQFQLAERRPAFFDQDKTRKQERHETRQFILRALKAFERADRSSSEAVPVELMSWFRSLEARLPEQLWHDDELRRPLQCAWAILHRDEPSPNTPPDLCPEALALLTRRRALSPRRYRVWQVGEGLLVLPAEVSPDGGPPQPRPGTEQSPVGSPIAEIVAGAPELAIAAPGQAGTSHPIPSSPDKPIPWPSVTGIPSGCTLLTDRGPVTLDIVARPPWAERMGRDTYGLYAEFEYRGVVQRMRWIAPGRFTMGSPETKEQREADEVPHEVELTEGYWMGDTACTQELWEKVMGENPSGFNEPVTGERSRPVENVSWEDCQRFVERINGEVPGLEFRLPTEAEWEYACRAGTQTPFSFGENITPEHVNYNGDYPYEGGVKGKYRKETVPVASLPANSWGLHEMHGNVLEWCSDWYEEYEGAKATDPRGPKTRKYRVLRGGSWYGYARFVRSAQRYNFEPGIRDYYFGFRLVRGRTGEQEESGATGPREVPRGRGAADDQRGKSVPEPPRESLLWRMLHRKDREEK